MKVRIILVLAYSFFKEPSEFEKHQQAMLEQMEQLEHANLADKSWQLTGEVDARARPINSLLAEDLTFEHSFKGRPVISEEQTKDLESIIISRTVAGIYDDPVPPKKDNGEQVRKEIELKHEKSKKSLAEIYEEEYLKRVEGINPGPNREPRSAKHKG